MEEDECEWEREVLHVEECEGFKKEEMTEVLSEFSDILSEILGKTGHQDEYRATRGYRCHIANTTQTT